jgi:gliding motility-associated-like protein
MNGLKRPSRVLAATILLLGIVDQGRGFTPTYNQAFTATATIGGTPFTAQKPNVFHSPLEGASPVTDVIIIQGQAGLNATRNADFPSRISAQGIHTKGDPQTPAESIKVTVTYRTQNPDGSWSLPVELDPVQAPDPVAFKFQIDPSAVQIGSLQYKIVAERLDPFGVQISSASYPPEAITNNDVWVSIGVRAQASNLMSVAGGRVVIHDGNPNDGESYVDVPAGLFSEPTGVTLNEVPVNSPVYPSLGAYGTPLAVYQFHSDQPFPTSMSASLLYQDFSFANGQDGILDGTTIPENMASVIWWDGFTWRRLGGQVNPALNTLSVRIGSNMKFLAIVPAGALTAADRRPAEKIFTPNDDGINDTISFSFGDLTSNVKVEIFDVTGRRVRSLLSLNTQQWDGRDDDGKVVESGVYIYQYDVDGKRISGVVAVAK